ncbi:hypothetical protein [Neorhizobium alkalisoli]|uniref:Uncharacterized protein n=1 Tax=Neorhizobium alkalisoli TaxID=528178 RepID=A0A561QS66_9HYPH|nr:hypothetical protein [Neorhizobium alkalisoli]TWF53214.1 hypothetical protein FHW37_104489 [Neorhizobium alkalisoli]
MTGVLGFSFQKAKIRYSLLVEEDGNLTLASKGKIDYDADLELPNLADRWSLSLNEILDETKPNLLAALQVYDSDTLDTAKFQIMPLTSLANIAFNRNLKLQLYTGQSLRSGKPFGLDPKTRPINEVDNIFGSHPPYWDDFQRKSVLVAWRAYREA